MQECWVLGSVDLPVESFIVEANVNILTSLLFLKKKTDNEKNAIALNGEPEYPVFMAVAEKVGFDRRGNTLYERHPDGEEIVEEKEVEERIRINGKNVVRKLKRRSKILNDDLPKIAAAFKEFRKENPDFVADYFKAKRRLAKPGVLKKYDMNATVAVVSEAMGRDMFGWFREHGFDVDRSKSEIKVGK